MSGCGQAEKAKTYHDVQTPDRLSACHPLHERKMLLQSVLGICLIFHLAPQLAKGFSPGSRLELVA